MTEIDTFEELKYKIVRDNTGTFYFDNEGRYHREDGQPAIIRTNGDKEWWVNGKESRPGDLPNKVRGNGQQEWTKNGKFHRDGDKPALISHNGVKQWFKNGQRHRDDGKPAVVYKTSLAHKGWGCEYWEHDEFLGVKGS